MSYLFFNKEKLSNSTSTDVQTHFTPYIFSEIEIH